MRIRPSPRNGGTLWLAAHDDIASERGASRRMARSLGRIEEANAEGLRITAQILWPADERSAGFRAVDQSVQRMPQLTEVKDLAFETRMARLRDPGFAGRLISSPAAIYPQAAIIQQWDRIFPSAIRRNTNRIRIPVLRPRPRAAVSRRRNLLTT